ncbi:MAG: GNAT family N-acetyltransferase [Thermoanaerobaculum sp.]|nr:GNAT family N-acetyltransferase [Thermoanaerobaculum sp.]
MAQEMGHADCQVLFTADEEAYTLEVATPRDLAALYSLDRLCFGYRAWSWRAWREVVVWPGWTCLVLRGRWQMVGAMVLLLWPPVAQLSSLAVHPNFRGKGLGSGMLADALERARRASCRWMSLEVDRESPAVRLYRRFGFGVVRRFTEDGIERLEMMKRLAEQR